MDSKVKKVIVIDGKEFFLLDNIEKYYYFSEVNNPSNICILKESMKNGKEIFVNMKKFEIDKALQLYSEKYKEVNN